MGATEAQRVLAFPPALGENRGPQTGGNMRTATRLISTLGLVLALCSSAHAAGTGKNYEDTPQVKAYRAQVKAIQAGDYDAYKKTMTKATAAQMDQQLKEMGMDKKKGMEMMKALLPSDIKFTDVKVDKNKATLSMTGMMDKELNKGTVDMEQEDGQWKIGKQSWTNAK
jgi:hypothetical protein